METSDVPVAFAIAALSPQHSPQHRQRRGLCYPAGETTALVFPGKRREDDARRSGALPSASSQQRVPVVLGGENK